MTEEIIKIDKWNVPSRLFNEYVRFSVLGDKYLLKKLDTPSHTEFERKARWLLCVKRAMELHREICKEINVEYSENPNDEFYSKFHQEVNKQKERLGEI